MAFVSINEMKKFTREDKRYVGPTLTINKRGVGFITRAVYGDIKPTTIEVEVDFDEKLIRLITGDVYAKKLVGRLKHTFNIPVSVRRKLLSDGHEKMVVPLTQREDGWWYGNYSEAVFYRVVDGIQVIEGEEQCGAE